MSDTIEDIRARHATTTLRADGSHAAFHAHYDRATLLAEVDRLTRERDEARAEVERLREEIRCLGLSEALAKHSGSSGREWHSVGAWLYAGETINHVIRSPREEPEVKP